MSRLWRVPVWNEQGDEVTVEVAAPSREDAAVIATALAFRTRGWRSVTADAKRCMQVTQAQAS